MSVRQRWVRLLLARLRRGLYYRGGCGYDAYGNWVCPGTIRTERRDAVSWQIATFRCAAFARECDLIFVCFDAPMLRR